MIISSDEDKGFVVKEIYNKLVDPKRISEKDIEIKQRRKSFNSVTSITQKGNWLKFQYNKGIRIKQCTQVHLVHNGDIEIPKYTMLNE